MTSSPSLASFAPALFGAAAVFQPNCGHAFDDRRFDPMFRLGLFWRVASAGMARMALERHFPVEDVQDRRKHPTLADLEFLKNVVKVLRTAGRVTLGHSQALNKVASFWGYRSWGALQSNCHGALETTDERCVKLSSLAVVALTRLSANVPDDEFADLVQLAAGIPVLEYTFDDYPSGSDKPVMRIYASGVAHVTVAGPHSTLYAYQLDKLHLQAVDYRANALPQVTTLEQFKACARKDLVRVALWSSAPYMGTEQLGTASDETLEEALDDGLPLGHYVVLTHRANAEVHGGLAEVVLGLPAYYDFAVGVASTIVDGDSLFSDEPGETETLELAAS